jgi:molecular chaperone DnaK
VKIKLDNQQLTPQEISAKILRSLKESAEAYLGHTVNKAVITTPAYFNDSQRQATKDACRIAGLDVARIINEPTAAALAYGLDRKKNGSNLVFDLGGGSCDVSVLKMATVAGEDEGESQVCEVISTSGDTHLGGDDFREALVDFVVNHFRSSTGIDLRKTAAADLVPMVRVREACERAKIELSDSPQAVIHLPFITADASGPKTLGVPVTRETYEQLTRGLVARCQVVIERALRDANLMASEIDNIILIGGTTRAPHIREMVQRIFDKEPHFDVNPMETVAIGAAIQGAVLAGDRTDVLLMDVTPLTLGIETKGGVMTSLVDRNTSIPTEKKQTFSTSQDNQKAVTVRVFQGERKMVADNILLAEVDLEGIPLASKGIPQIEVTFDIDQNGILNVSASDVGTGKAVKVKFRKSSGLSDKQIKQARAESAAEVINPI